MLYSHNHDQLYKHMIHIHLHMHAHLYAEHNDTIKSSDTVLLEKYTSHFIWKACVVRGTWRTNRTATYWPSHAYGHLHFLSRSPGLLNRKPGAQLSARCWLSLPHLVTNWSGLQNSIGGPEGPFYRVLFFSTASSLQTHWLPVFTELYNSSTPTPLEWHVLIVIKRK